MAGTGRIYETNQPIRWQKTDWDGLAGVAQSLGISRSEFVRAAALHAAKAVQAGVTPYFVGEANASLQNMGASFFSCEADQKLARDETKSASPGRGAIAKQRAIGSVKTKD